MPSADLIHSKLKFDTQRFPFLIMLEMFNFSEL